MVTTYKQWCERYERDPDTQQARDEYAEFCRQLEIFETVAEKQKGKRGPKPIHGKPMTAAERMARTREKRRAKGMRQVWLTREQLAYLQQLQDFKAAGEPFTDEWANAFFVAMADIEL